MTAMLELVNRDIYPARSFPYAQFDYMQYYEHAAQQVTALFDSDPDRAVRALYRRGDPVVMSGPAPRAFVTRDGGWFGGAAVLPDLPRDPVILTEEIYDELVHAFTVSGFWGPACYYLNSDGNRRYSDESVDDGYLHRPALFVEAQFDPAADTIRSRMAEPMRQYCTALIEASFPAGHWVGLEKAAAVNAALLDWLNTRVIACPG
jgi:soluble epoxide hydrolase / lipid-phosphate phosphatase